MSGSILAEILITTWTTRKFCFRKNQGLAVVNESRLFFFFPRRNTSDHEVAGKLTFSKKVGNIDILIFLDRYYFALFFFTHTYVC